MKTLQISVDSKASAIAVLRHVWPQDGWKCWEWAFEKTKGGYGIIRVGSRFLYVHRLAAEMYYGPIPPRRHVMHSCDNPACWNPSHLGWGTRSDNMRDMVRKGRNR